MAQTATTLSGAFTVQARALFVGCLILACAAGVARGQNTSSTDGSTPLALSPGAPAGSYALSGFDNVNLFNGNLNFRLPLDHVAGRGGAQHTITLPVEQHWTVRHFENDYQESDYPEYNRWYTTKPGYGPGVLAGRQVDGGNCNAQTREFYTETLTRLTFVAPDGTEYELRDQQSGGQPKSSTCPYWSGTSQGYNRGSVFVTADGTAATFVSDAPIYDFAGGGVTGARWLPEIFYPSGYLMFRNGTRYRIDSGQVTWTRDRNGNMLYFSYGPQTLITDSLNRQVSISYADLQTVFYDQITFSGFGGAARTIRINYDTLDHLLRTNRPGDQSAVRTFAALFPELNGSASSYFDPYVVSSVELPNGQQYQFLYNIYGELARVTLPTGGAFEYDFGNGIQNDLADGVVSAAAPPQIYRRVLTRRVYTDAGTTLEGMMTYSRPEGGTPSYVQVDHLKADGATLLAREKHYFFGAASASLDQDPFSYPAWRDGREYQSEAVNTDGSTVLRREQQTWQQRAPVSWWTGSPDSAPLNDPRITQTVNTIEPATSNLVSAEVFSYDDSAPFNNRSDVYEYDFGAGAAGPFVRRTHADYVTTPSYVNADVNPALGASLRGLPLQQWVSADIGGTNQASLTTYAYDQSGLSDCPNITVHDAAFTTGFATRGNATSVTRYTDAAGGTGAVTATAQYDIAGNAVSATDARGNTSQVSYSDSFSDGVARNTYAFSTATTSPVPDPTGQYGSATALTTSSVYDYSTGLVTSATDPNGVASSFAYADPLDRPTQAVYAVGTSAQAQTSVAYDDAGRAVTATSDQSAYGDNLLKGQTLYDGLGRTVETRQYESATSYISSTRLYDALGRAYLVSRPSREQGATTDGWARSSFDALGRAVEAATFAGAAQPPATGTNASWTGSVTTSYTGQYVTVTDQAGKVRRSKTDALGRLVRVDEPDGGGNLGTTDSPAQATSYTYDVLGNLRGVDQGAQVRFFMYDSLSRLVRAKNPEQAAGSAASNMADPVTGNNQWSLAYGYDSDGNLTARVDARNVTTTYGYDSLNRSTTVRYTDGTKDIDRHYDGAVNGKGRFYYFNWDPNNNTRFDTHLAVDQYDAMGRPLVYRQHFLTNGVASAAFTTTRTYDKAGHVLTQTYPSTHSVSYSYDGAGRLGDSGTQVAFSGNLGDGVQRTYSSQVLYDESGGMRQEVFGTDTPLYHKLLYNSRGQLAEIRVGTTALPDTGWQRGAIINHYSDAPGAWGATGGGSDNNGNLHRQDVFIPNFDGAGYDQGGNYGLSTQSFSYDSLNRLTSAAESSAASWTQVYTYDPFGNRTINSSGTVNAPATQFDAGEAQGTNRLYAPGDTALPAGQRRMQYDAAGNLAYNNYTGAGARTYDAENRMTSAQTGASQSSTYTYDSDGRRVKRNTGAGEVWQVYGVGGELLAEYAANAAPTSPQEEYGYRGGELLVTATAPTGGWGAAPAFDDNPLNPNHPGETPIRSAHITQLRSAIDSLRSHLGLAPYPWNAPAGVGDPVKIDPIVEMRAALDQALGAPSGGYSVGLAQWQPILAIHIQELRKRVLDAWQGGGGVADVRWLVADQLGTPRMVIDHTGSLAGVKRHDYLPFGEEVSAGVGGRTIQQGYVGDNIRQKFTGSERDGETGLDYMQARYMSSTQGRFTSTDPLLSSGKPLQPQSWNRYTYTLNNPLKFIDPSGLIWGRKDGADRYSWFDDEDAMKKAGYSAVTDFLYKGKDGQFYAVNPNANEWKSFNNAWDAERTYWGYTGLQSSWQDWVPAWGQFRRMMFNVATENYEGAMGNFMMSSVDGGTLAAGAMGRGGTAAVSLVDDAARVVAENGTTTLYRAVSQAEFEQIMKDGVFKASSNSLGGKWFAESAEHAAQWGQKLEGTSGFRIVDVRIPTVQADKLMRIGSLDGIGPARYAELNQLRNATIGVVK